jgi:hypothetical protein
MLVLIGSPALSDFRLQQIEKQLGSLLPGLSGLKATYIHFARTECDLSTEEQAQLAQLLDYGKKVRISYLMGRKSLSCHGLALYLPGRVRPQISFITVALQPFTV